MAEDIETKPTTPDSPTEDAHKTSDDSEGSNTHSNHEPSNKSDGTRNETSKKPMSRTKKIVIAVGVVVALLLAGFFGWPILQLKLNTISTDDAYVDGHETNVAARVSGQITSVLVEDNNRVAKGDLLATLDPIPYQAHVAIKQAAVDRAQADLVGAKAKVRAMIGQTRADLYSLELAIEKVRDSVAMLKSSVAALDRSKADLELARSNFERIKLLKAKRAVSDEEYDTELQQLKVKEAALNESTQEVYANRVSLGLHAKSDEGESLASVPDNVEQNFASVRVALGNLTASAAKFGYYPIPWDAAPREAIELYHKNMKEKNLDALYQKLIDEAPTVKLAEAGLMQAKRDLDVAQLNLKYCNIISEIDGVVTRRNVNPGQQCSSRSKHHGGTVHQ